jgi:sucrose-6-phosphate hydrolase SacC (GH32 family)
VWGHAASRDLVSWARLPVALWNDRPFDRVNVYTGSATIGVPGLGNVIVYTVRWCVVPRVAGGATNTHMCGVTREPNPVRSRRYTA